MKNFGKKIVQDIVPGERRSIRKIEINREEEPAIATPITRTKEPKIKKKRSSFTYLLTFILIFVSIAVIGIALSLSYSKALITITPKVVNFNVDGTFTAKKTTQDDLTYESITVSDTTSQVVSATKGPLVQTKAKGVVTIYNNYGAAAQTLVAGTRISTPEGKIYRTSTTVSVPGKKSLPGAISVSVVADQASADYNLYLAEYKSEFKLPGYKSSDKYNGFYAKLKTDIVGGFYGNKLVINEQSKKDTIKIAQDSLKEKLLEKLKENVPLGSVLYDKAYTIEYIVSEPEMKGSDEGEITVKGNAYGAIFNRDTLLRFIAGKEIKKFPSDTYSLQGDKELTFNILNAKDFSVKKGTPLIFSLKGPVSITGTFSEEELKNDLKGIKIQDSAAVFAKYTSISNAYSSIKPFWMRSFPDSLNKINIEYKH